MYKIETEKEVVKIEKTVVEVTIEQYVGHILTKEREDRKLTRAQVVDQVNEQISTTHLKNIENGLLTMRLRDMVLLSDFYSIPISKLFPAPQSEVLL